MAKEVESISYIDLGDGINHPFDASFVDGKSAAEIGELVTSIDSTSTDSQYPSAKCVHDIIYGPTES